MKTVIIAVAGVSGRFNENEKEKVLKAIYSTTDKKKTLLYSILKKCNDFDRIVIVGGYQYEQLKEYVENCRTDFSCPICLTYNPHYEEYGTGYTLKVGIEESLRQPCSEITFVEGDLFFDEESFQKILETKQNAATYSRKTIFSNKAVIAYVNQERKLKYAFSTEHGAVSIKEPFFEIYNSGQIWKFVNIPRVKKLFDELPEEMWKKTNLSFIQTYFSEIEEKERKMIEIKKWENCNLRSDYQKCVDLL